MNKFNFTFSSMLWASTLIFMSSIFLASCGGSSDPATTTYAPGTPSLTSNNTPIPLPIINTGTYVQINVATGSALSNCMIQKKEATGALETFATDVTGAALTSHPTLAFVNYLVSATCQVAGKVTTLYSVVSEDFWAVQNNMDIVSTTVPIHELPIIYANNSLSAHDQSLGIIEEHSIYPTQVNVTSLTDVQARATVYKLSNGMSSNPEDLFLYAPNSPTGNASLKNALSSAWGGLKSMLGGLVPQPITDPVTEPYTPNPNTDAMDNAMDQMDITFVNNSVTFTSKQGTISKSSTLSNIANNTIPATSTLSSTDIIAFSTDRGTPTPTTITSAVGYTVSGTGGKYISIKDYEMDSLLRTQLNIGASQKMTLDDLARVTTLDFTPYLATGIRSLDGLEFMTSLTKIVGASNLTSLGNTSALGRNPNGKLSSISPCLSTNPQCNSQGGYFNTLAPNVASLISNIQTLSYAVANETNARSAIYRYSPSYTPVTLDQIDPNGTRNLTTMFEAQSLAQQQLNCTGTWVTSPDGDFCHIISEQYTISLYPTSATSIAATPTSATSIAATPTSATSTTATSVNCNNNFPSWHCGSCYRDPNDNSPSCGH